MIIKELKLEDRPLQRLIFLQILTAENPRIKKFYELVKKENALELFK